MTSLPRNQRRLIVLGAARGLVHAARSRRASLPAHSADREFYRGVEAAAEEVVHPELGESRGARWLERETLMFREGYLRTSAVVALARTAPQPPLRLPLPEPASAERSGVPRQAGVTRDHEEHSS